MRLFFITSLLSLFSLAQVGINTSNPDPSSIFQIDSTTGTFVPPRMTSAQAALIVNPLKGAMVYLSDVNSLATFDGLTWIAQAAIAPLPVSSITLYRNIAGSETIKGNSSFQNIPLGETLSEIKSNDPTYFEFISDGKVRVKIAGTYQISGGIAVRDFKTGDNKYILAVFKNNNRHGYLSRGYASMPRTDYWGTSGVFQDTFAVNDVIEVRYYITNPGGTDLNGDFANMAITKL